MRFLVDSNYGERDVSFSPLRAYVHEDGSVTVINSCNAQEIREEYPSLQAAAEERSFIRRWMNDRC